MNSRTPTLVKRCALISQVSTFQKTAPYTDLPSLWGKHDVSIRAEYALISLSLPVDMRQLPSLVPPDIRNETAHAILPALQSRIDHIRSMLNNADLSTDSASPSSDPPASNCSFHVYAQVSPSNVTADEMLELEEELANPTGAATVSRPPLLVSAVLLSQECGLLLRVEEAEGLRSKTFFRKVTSCI